MKLRPKWIFNNIGLKLTAFVFAVIVWIYIQGELGFNVTKYAQGYSYEKKVFKNVPIDVLMTLEGDLDVSVMTKSFDLTIEGKGEDLDNILSGDIFAFIDVRSVQSEGLYQVPVQIEHIPSNVTVVGKLPAVEVSVEKKPLLQPKSPEIKNPAEEILGI